MSLGPLYFLLGEAYVQVLCLCFNWVFCLPGVESFEFLYIWEIKPLSEETFANTFSHILSSPFTLLLFSLAVQKLCILIRSHLFILLFISLPLMDISVKTLEYLSFLIFLNFLLLFNYSCLHFLPIPPPHPS